jgi:hypothetical protein
MPISLECVHNIKTPDKDFSVDHTDESSGDGAHLTSSSDYASSNYFNEHKDDMTIDYTSDYDDIGNNDRPQIQIDFKHLTAKTCTIGEIFSNKK